MANRVRYGTPNMEMLGRWMQLDPADDGPFWALNLMKYRAVAAYDGDAPEGTVVSGREADDAYAPTGPLAAIGAAVAYHGDVVDQPVGEPRWDRVGIVRYPTRAAFFAMQRRDDFKEKHVHKDAGMEQTIVMSTLPVAHTTDDREGHLVLVVDRNGSTASVDGVHEAASFSVEGVIVGDERTFDRVRFLRARTDAALAALVESAKRVPDSQVLLLQRHVNGLIGTVTEITGGAAS